MGRRCAHVALMCLLVVPAASLAQSVGGVGGAERNRANAADGWSGQVRCVVSARSIGYQDDQTHTWVLSGPPAARNDFRDYPATWTLSGSGSRTPVSARATAAGAGESWTSSAPGVSTSITIFVPTGTTMIRIAAAQRPVRATGGLRGSSASISGDITEWRFQFLDVADGATRSSLTGSRTQMRTDQIGPRQPPGSPVTETCSWSLTKAAVAVSAQTAARANTTTASPISPAGQGQIQTPVLGGTNDGDILAAAFLVLMSAAKETKNELEQIMATVKAQNAAKSQRAAAPAERAKVVPPGSVGALDPCFVLTTDVAAVFDSTAASLAAAFDARTRELDDRAAAVNADRGVELTTLAARRLASITDVDRNYYDGLIAAAKKKYDTELAEIAKARESVVKAAAAMQSELQKQKQQILKQVQVLCETGPPDAAALDAFRTSVQSNLQQLAAQVIALLDREKTMPGTRDPLSPTTGR